MRIRSSRPPSPKHSGQPRLSKSLSLKAHQKEVLLVELIPSRKEEYLQLQEKRPGMVIPTQFLLNLSIWEVEGGGSNTSLWSTWNLQ